MPTEYNKFEQDNRKRAHHTTIEDIVSGLQHLREHNNTSYDNSYGNEIALMKMRGFQTLHTNADTSRVLMSKAGIRNDNPSTVSFPELESEVLDMYHRAGVKLFNTGSINKSGQLVFQHVKSRMVKQGPTELQAAWQNVLSKGKFVYWDTETFSGTDKYGHHHTDALTEFNFRVVTRNADGTWDLSNKAEDNKGKVFKSIIGSTQEQFEYYNSLIDRYKAGGKNAHFSELERVTLERLALIGSSETSWTIDKHGVANYITFAGKDTADVKSMSYDVLRRGAEQMREIGRLQEKSKPVTFMRQKMFGHERELLRGLHFVLANDVTAMGYNTAGFDWPTLQAAISRMKTSEGFKNALRAMIKNPESSILPKYQLDVMAGLQNAGLSRFELYTEKQWKQLAEHDLTALQQEALTYRGDHHDEWYQGLNAHMADTDTYIGAKLVVEGDLMDELMGLEKQVKNAGSQDKLLDGQRQLFMSTTGQHISEYGLWGFRKDAYSGEYRTTDGYAMASDGSIHKESFDQWLFKKEAVYTINEITAFDPDKDKRTIFDSFGGSHQLGMGQILGVGNHDLQKDGLYTVTFSPVVSEGEETYLSKAPITIVGTKDKIEQYISQTMYHVGDKDTNGEWVLGQDRQMRKDLSLITKTNGEIHYRAGATLSERGEEHLLNYIIANGTERLKYESAARTTRDFNYKKDTGILAFVRDMREFTRKYKLSPEKGQEAFIKLVEDNSKKLTKRLKMLRSTSPNARLEDEEYAATFQGYFGFKNREQDWNRSVYTETIANQLARINLIEANEGIYETSIRHARKRVGLPELPTKGISGTNYFMSDTETHGKKDLVAAYYRQYMQGFISASANYFDNDEIARNMEVRPAYAYTKDVFEVNLRGYKPEITQDKYISFDLSASGTGYADKLFRAIGIDPEKRGFKSHERVKELQKLQKWLVENGALPATFDALYGSREIYRAVRKDLTEEYGWERIKGEVVDGKERFTEEQQKEKSRRKQIVDARYKEVLNRNGDFYASTWIRDDDHPELAAQRLIRMFQYERDKNPLSGIDNDTKRFVLSEFAMNDMGLQRADIEKVVKTLDESIPTISIKNGDDIKVHAKEITDKILFGGHKEEELQATLKKSGYTDDQIKLLLGARNQRFSDTLSFMENFLESAIRSGVDVGYDIKQGSAWFAYRGEALLLDDLLPKDVYENGMFYTKIGRTKTASPLGLYNVNGKLQFGSLVAKAAPSRQSIVRAMTNGVERDDMLGQLSYLAHTFNKTLRESSSVSGMDAQDRKAGMYFSWGDAVEHISELPFAEDFHTGNEAIDEILNDLIHGYNNGRSITSSTITTSQRIAINDQRETILMAAARAANAPKFVLDRIATLDYSTKKAGEFVATFDPLLDFGENVATTKRGIHNQSSRAIPFNLTRAKKYLDDDYDVKYGQAISTPNRAFINTHIDENLGYSVETSARLNRLATSTREFRQLVNDMGVLGDDDYSLNLLSSAHTDEGSGIIDGRIADRLFSYRNSVQKVGFDSIFEYDETIADFERALFKDIHQSGDESDRVVPFIKKRSAAAFTISYDKKFNRFKFAYGEGAFVRAGENFLAKKGYDGAAEAIAAKESGVLRLGAFSKDGRHLADAKAINQLINGAIKLKKDATKEQVEEATRAAFKLIQENYDLSYYIKGLEAATNIKAAEMGTEKGMMRSMIASTGAINKKIAAVLDETGLSSLKSVALDIEYIDSLSNNAAKYQSDISHFTNSIFGVMAQNISGRNAADIAKTIEQRFGSIGKFHEALLEERYTPWDRLIAGLDDYGVHEQIHVISNTQSAEKKHKDAKAVVGRVANALLDKYDDDREKVLSLLRPVVPQLQLGQDSDFVVDGDYSINLGAMEKLVQGEGLTSKRTVALSNGNAINVDTARVDVEMEPNFDRGRSYAMQGALKRAIKLDHRAMAVLNTQRINDTRKGRVKSALISDLGEDLGTELYNKFVSGYKDNDIIASGAAKTIRHNIYTRPGESEADNIARYDPKNERIVLSPELVKSLDNDGINSDIAESIVQIAQERGAKQISRRVIEERFAAQSFAHAFQFNQQGSDANALATLPQEMRDNAIRISDMTMPKNGASSTNFADSAYNKEFLLDLHLDRSNTQIYAEGTGIGRYIYVPYAPPKKMPNGDLALSPYHVTLNKISNLVTNFNERMSMDAKAQRGPMSPDEQDRFRSQLITLVDQLQTDIRKGLTSKTGYIANMSRAYFEDSGIYTAYGNQLFGGEKSKFFSSLEFQGINLSKLASKGENAALDLDYTILSKAAMHNFYDSKIEDLGLNDAATEKLRQNLYRDLETKGTLALNIREPQGYAKSTSVSATYFSDIVRGDEAIVGAVQHNSKKGDYDSDKVEAALLKGRAIIKVGRNEAITRDLDWALYNQLQGMDGVSVSWETPDVEQMMNNHISAVLVNAESNKLWRMKDNILQKDRDSYAAQHLATYTVEGTSTGTLVSRMKVTDGHERDVLRKRFDSLLEDAKSYYSGSYSSTDDGAFEKFMTSPLESEADDKLNNIDIDSDAYKRRKIYTMLQDDDIVQEFANNANMSVAEYRNSAQKAMAFHLTEHLNKMEATTSSLKLGAGEMNYNLYGYLKVAQESNAVSAEDFAKIMQIHTALGEAFLSPKNETGLDPKQIDKLKTAMSNAYKAMQGYYDKNDAAEEFKGVIRDTLMGRMSKEMSQLPVFLNNPSARDSEEARRAAVEDAMDAYTTRLINGTNLRGASVKMYDIAITKGMENPNSQLVLSTDATSDLPQESLQDLNAQAKLQGREAPVSESRGARAVDYSYEEKRAAIQAAKQAALDTNTPSAALLEDRPTLRLDSGAIRPSGATTTDALKAIASAVSHMHAPKGSGVAIAGGLLLSGYVNNPSTPAPATSQADGAEEEFRDMYSASEVPSFSDSNLNTMRGGPKQGYVINISAQTADGRQQAVDAINSAIGGAVPSASSINVAMNTSYADKISQFQIDKMVANAF